MVIPSEYENGLRYLRCDNGGLRSRCGGSGRLVSLETVVSRLSLKQSSTLPKLARVVLQYHTI